MIDLEALAKIAEGDPNGRVTVRRAWLQEVLRQLLTARQREAVGKAGDTLTDMLRHIYRDKS